MKAEEVIREGILVSPNMATDHYAMTLQVRLSALKERIYIVCDPPLHFAEERPKRPLCDLHFAGFWAGSLAHACKVVCDTLMQHDIEVAGL